MRKFALAVLCLVLLFGQGLIARAQGQARADLYPVDASAFPTVTALLDVFDAGGTFVTGLKPDAVKVLEDAQTLPLQELTEQAVPAQIVVAVNPGPPLDVRDGQGVSRFQRIGQALGQWAQARPADLPDDISLVTIAGPIITHASAKDWQVSLSTFQPDFRATTPNLQSLSIAIDTASAQVPRAGVKRALLFITPHMEDANLETTLQPLIQRAVQNRVRVYVWFVDADSFFMTTSAAHFNDLALQTGGAFFTYSGSQPLPDPEAYFAPLRRVYSLKYSSAVNAGGPHTISLQIQTPAGRIASAEQTFDVNIQPPNPIFVSPPLQITRQAPPEDPFNTKLLLPEAQEIDLLVEFPDGHARPLVRTTLYVDGQIAAENTAEPFDKFQWDLSGYKLSGEHKLIAEAVDSLGLSRTSMEFPVTVTVIQPPRGPAAFFGKYRQAITLGAIGLAGFALLAVLLTGRLRLPSLRARAAERKAFHDPVTQPVTAAVEPLTGPKDKTRRRRAATGRARQADAPAYLVRLNADLQPAPASALPVAEKELTFGTDPVQSTHVLDDASIAPLHARLLQTEAGGFLLMDPGTVAGTWVNFEPVEPEGHPLRHGDVIHFGQMAFRFELKNPPPAAEPVITPE
jgi:hypothetical protein